MRIIRNFVERWDRTPLGEQERIIGRKKATGAPHGGGNTEHDVPDYSKDPEGKVTPLDAHIRLANFRTAGFRGKSDSCAGRSTIRTGSANPASSNRGFLFICYQADLEKGFITVQRQLDGEPLEEYIKPIGGGFFFTPPGPLDETDFVGRTLLEAAGHAVTRIKS